MNASSIAAWWAASKVVAILGLLLVLSLWGNLHQYGKLKQAKADCRTEMVEAAKAGIEAERARAAKADTDAGKIAGDTRNNTRSGTAKAQGNTNARQNAIQNTRTDGSCRMPAGLPKLDAAVNAANAAARD